MAASPVNPANQHAIVDLTSELTQVAGMDHGASGRIAHPLVSLPGLRVLLVSMKRGAHWLEHSTPGRITVQPLFGEIHLRWQHNDALLSSGKLAALASNVPHDVVAETDAAFLLTVARPQAD